MYYYLQTKLIIMQKKSGIIGIVALQHNNMGIGYEEKLLHKCREDMQFFTKTTKEGISPCIIMGRKTFFSIPKKLRPLENRTSIVISRDWLQIMADYPGVYAFPTPEESLDWARFYHDRIYICGGGEVYKALLSECGALYVTKIYADQQADTFFPSFESQFRFDKQIQQGLCDDGITSYIINRYLRQFTGEGDE